MFSLSSSGLGAARESMVSGQPILEARNISKSFGAVEALRNVSFTLHRGEVLGLVGDNGAGKTTLVNCLSGGLHPDSGEVLVDGESVTIDDPHSARSLGIETVYQDLALVEALDVATNLFLNREVTRGPNWLGFLGFVNKRTMYRETERILDKLSIRVPSVRQHVAKLSGGQRQSIAVGRAVAWGRHIVLMDEPAAALGVEQSRLVLDLIRRLRNSHVGVLLISHNMQHVVDVCDRVIVLRHGEMVGNVSISDVTPRDLVDLITGAALTVDDLKRR